MRARPFSSNQLESPVAKIELRYLCLLVYCIAMPWLCSGCAAYQSVVEKFEFDGHAAAAKSAAKKEAAIEKSTPASLADGDINKKSEKTDAPSNSQAMKDLMAEIETVGATDPAERDELLKDLKQTDPSLWPMEIRAYRAAAAYHKRRESKEKETAVDDRDDVAWNMQPIIKNRVGRADKTSIPATQIDSGPDASRPAFSPEQLNNGPTSADAPLAPDLTSVAAADTPTETAPTAAQSLSSIASRAALGSAFTSAPVSAATPEPSSLGATHTEITAADGTRSVPATLNSKPLLASAARLIASPADAAGATNALAGMAGETKQAGYLAQDLQSSSVSSGFATQVAYAGVAAVTKSGDRTASVAGDPRWQEHLAETIRALEANRSGSGSGEGDIASQARLRMLYLLAGRRDDAMRPLPAAPKASQDYWTKQIYGLSTWLDTQGTPDSARRAAATKRILDEAVVRLGETAPLGVRNLSFCSAVKSYGSIKTYSSTQFVAGQEVLLYAEVENFVVETTAKGNHTSLKLNYQIFDSSGQRVSERESPPVEEYCQSPRRDFFVSYGLFLPKRPSPGTYKLQLTVEDMIGHKVGQATVDFTLKSE